MQDNPQVKYVCWKKKYYWPHVFITQSMLDLMYCSFYKSVSLCSSSMILACFVFLTCLLNVNMKLTLNFVWSDLDTAGTFSTLLHMVCHFTGVVKHWNKVQHSGCHVLSFIYTHDDLVTHALVWLSTVQLSASNMNSRRSHTFKHKICFAYG